MLEVVHICNPVVTLPADAAGILGRHAAEGAPAASASGQGGEDSRSELLRGSRYLPDTKGKGSIRTADEIRSAYGRSNTR